MHTLTIILGTGSLIRLRSSVLASAVWKKGLYRLYILAKLFCDLVNT